MLLILQLLILFFLLLVAYKSAKNDVFSPTVLFVIGYIITTTFAIYNAQKWNSKILFMTVLIVVLGCGIFWITEEFWKKIRLFSKQNKCYIVDQQLKEMVIKPINIKLIIIIIGCALATLILYREVSRIAYSNFRGWGNLIYNYRHNRSNEEINSVARLANYFTKAFAHVYLFGFINNITNASKKFKITIFLKNIALVIPGIFYAIQALLLGGRIGIIAFIIEGVFFYNLLIQYKYNNKIHIDIVKFIKIIVVFIIICILFFNVQELIGRDQGQTTVLDYIATYLGGSMDLFSQYIMDPKGCTHFHETFAGIIDNMQNYLGILKNISITTTHEFRSTPFGVVIGNTYTGFRNYYNDFGILGVIGGTILFSSIFNIFNYTIKRIRRLTIEKIAAIIILGSEIYCVVFHFFCDYFLSGISINRIINYILIYLACTVVYKKRKQKI